MQIQSGKLYENRTYKYLFPIVKHYGEELTNYLRYFIKLGVGLGDDNRKLPAGCFFILIDTNPKIQNQKQYFEKLDRFLTWIKYQDYYVDDYIYCMKDDCSSHMVVLDMPSKYNTAYIKFIIGRYSQMYTEQEINKLFPIDNSSTNNKLISEYNDRIRFVRNVLLKKDESDFLKKVNKDFGTDLKKFSIDGELDYSPDLREEIFNFKN